MAHIKNTLKMRPADYSPPENGIKLLSPGNRYTGYCVLRKKELKTTRNGDPYLQLEVGDWTGRLRAKIWEKGEQHFNAFSVGQVIKIQATLQVYNNQRELRVLKIRSLKEGETVDWKQLLPACGKDIKELETSFFNHMAQIEEPHLKELLQVLFSDEQFAEKYLMVPAGKLWHHNYLFGMLEHVVTLLDMADTFFAHYPEIDIDLLKAGIICHDIGKITDFSFDSFIEYTDQGRLLGHIVMGYEYVGEKINRIKGFPITLKNQLLHLLLCHQSVAAKGSPVEPMTLEGFVLYYLNELDSKANAVSRIKKYDRQPGTEWSKFIPLIERFIYIGQESDKENSDE